MRKSRSATYQSEVQCSRVWQCIRSRIQVLGTLATPLPKAGRRSLRITKPVSTMTSFQYQSQHGSGSTMRTHDKCLILAVMALSTTSTTLCIESCRCSSIILYQLRGDMLSGDHGTARQSGHLNNMEDIIRKRRYDPHGVG